MGSWYINKCVLLFFNCCCSSYNWECVFTLPKKNVLLNFNHNIHDLVFVVEASALKNTSSVLYCDLFLYFSLPFMLCKHLSPLLLELESFTAFLASTQNAVWKQRRSKTVCRFPPLTSPHNASDPYWHHPPIPGSTWTIPPLTHTATWFRCCFGIQKLHKIFE